MRRLLSITTMLTALASTALAADAVGDAPKPKPYTLGTCVISGDKLDAMGGAVTVVREGREIKFCCKGCIKDFDKDPAKFIKKIDEAEHAKTDKPAATDHGAHSHHH